jgi:hypothetical protein
MEEYCGLPSKKDLEIVQQIMSLKPSAQSGGQRGGEGPTVVDYAIAAVIAAGIMGVSYAGVMALMTPQVTMLVGIPPPCAGPLDQLVGTIGIIGKTCAQRQSEFDATVGRISLLVFGAGGIGSILTLGSLTAIAVWVSTQRANCVTAAAGAGVNLTRGGRARRATKKRNVRKGRKNRATKSRR